MDKITSYYNLCAIGGNSVHMLNQIKQEIFTKKEMENYFRQSDGIFIVRGITGGVCGGFHEQKNKLPCLVY